ncbi:MAG: hypothetical protein Q9225_007058 [Loekoesia sp. 1 TL-2023]
MIAPSERGVALLSINAVFSTLAITSYVLRFRNNLSRAREGLLPMGHFIITDSLVFAATFLVILNCIFRIVSILLGGIGWDIERLTLDQVEWALKALFVEELGWTTSLCLLKFALIILYGRIFVCGSGRKKALVIQIIAFAAVGGLLIGSITYYLTECKPLPAAWTPNLGHCAKQRAGWLGTGIANLITDVIIFSVPIVWVLDLKMSLHNKIVVSLQLFIGAIVTIISFTRIFFVLKVNPMNVTGSVVRADIFSCIELNMAIVFASVSGIAGREAISNFVHRFIVPRSRTYGEVYRAEDISGSGSGLRDLHKSDRHSWQKLSTNSKTQIVANAEEAHNASTMVVESRIFIEPRVPRVPPPSKDGFHSQSFKFVSTILRLAESHDKFSDEAFASQVVTVRTACSIAKFLRIFLGLDADATTFFIQVLQKPSDLVILGLMEFTLEPFLKSYGLFLSRPNIKEGLDMLQDMNGTFHLFVGYRDFCEKPGGRRTGTNASVSQNSPHEITAGVDKPAERDASADETTASGLENAKTPPSDTPPSGTNQADPQPSEPETPKIVELSNYIDKQPLAASNAID